MYFLTCLPSVWASHSGNVPLRPPCFWPAKSWLFIFFFQLQSLRGFLKSASEYKLNNSGNNKTGTVCGHAWMIWCQFDVRRGDNIGPEAWILWFTSLHTCDYFKFESDHAKKYIWDNKTVYAHIWSPMTLKPLRVKINRTGHLINSTDEVHVIWRTTTEFYFTFSLFDLLYFTTIFFP